MDAFEQFCNEQPDVLAHIKPTGIITTHTGRKMDIFDPKPEDICIEDIAHGLSNLCRFNGQCKKFYSVAQHSIYVMLQLAVYMDQPQLAIPALLHDATEAYIGDVIRPLKHSIFGKEYRIIEARLELVIEKAFGVSFKDPLIKAADNTVLAFEARSMMPDPEAYKENNVGVTLKTFFTPERAKREFLTNFKWLSSGKRPKKAGR